MLTTGLVLIAIVPAAAARVILEERLPGHQKDTLVCHLHHGVRVLNVARWLVTQFLLKWNEKKRKGKNYLYDSCLKMMVV